MVNLKWPIVAFVSHGQVTIHVFTFSFSLVVWTMATQMFLKFDM